MILKIYTSGDNCKVCQKFTKMLRQQDVEYELVNLQCYKLDCQCDCELEHKKCRQTACDWRIEQWIRKEQDE